MNFREMLKQSFLRAEEALRQDALLPVMRADSISSQYVDARVNELYELVFSEERERLYTALKDENNRLHEQINAMRR